MFGFGRFEESIGGKGPSFAEPRSPESTLREVEMLIQEAITPALFQGSYEKKTVLVTGHTGFKGAWLSLWLSRLGARVVGYALPPTTPSLFEEARLEESLTHLVGDVRDREALERTLSEHQPEIVFHLAAQPLVRYSYRSPVETYETNVMGTVNLLEAIRQTPSVKACLVVTSDKCYENREWVYAYRENDAMGGYDPYSSSKGCAELVTAAYRNSFFQAGPAIASVRAGNVIGGGDWAEDRIVPDCMRALASGFPIGVRNPHAVRPWQHVLEPLSGYLWLGARLLQEPAPHAEAWNFGPLGPSNVTVREVVERLVAFWGDGAWHTPELGASQPHEAHFLKLDTTKATNLLGWRPVYDLETTLRAVSDWYAAFYRASDFDARAFTLSQIEAYERQATMDGLAWARERQHER